MPDYIKNIRKIKAEMPEVSSTKVEPMGFFGKFLSGNATATASPWTGNVSYNPDEFAKMSDDEIDNALTHEFTHTKQIQNMPFVQRVLGVGRSLLPGFEEPYHKRPREMEAYQSERDRTLRKDIRGMRDPRTGQRDIELYPQMPSLSKRRKSLGLPDY